ncbi:uncharacterized protein A4U43_C01F13610 [Asparagus officinalis]|uniref:Uncharacterized protein n=1 Tax=Asparagus officinalis TaxID=4686 RepID=A0A5P1FPX2_ASPOF|nr:uncharacterized protein A4U43_C01F13610 [Asparagus officinalis]
MRSKGSGADDEGLLGAKVASGGERRRGERCPGASSAEAVRRGRQAVEWWSDRKVGLSSAIRATAAGSERESEGGRETAGEEDG